MSTIDLSSYSKEELRDVLRIVKNYRASLKQIGSRSEIIDSKILKNKFFRIEYTSNADRDFVEKFANSACEKYFGNVGTNVAKKFVINEKIIGGIRIFYGDDMLDLSFQDVIANLV